MSKPIHTPGPIRVFSALSQPEIVTDRRTAHETQHIAKELTGPNAHANGRLLVAAYNAFDYAGKRIGCNAVELAERMQECDLAELVEAAAAFLYDHDLGYHGEEAYDSSARLREVLARVKGGAL